MSEFRDAALEYAARGWRVFPLRPRDKTPLVRGGLLSATTDPKRINRWWEKHPDANVGLVAGDGLAVLDVDVGKGGEESLRRFLKEHGPLQTLVVRTGTGGYHLYLADDPESPLPQSAGRLGDGLDVRAGGKGYVVAPPSIHPNGEPYAIFAERELAPVPGWLREAAGRRPEKTQAPAEGPVIEGERNQTLAALAGGMRRRGMSPEAILAALQAENLARCSPPLEEAEVEKIAASVARYAPDPVANLYGPRAEDEFEAVPGAEVSASTASLLTDLPTRQLGPVEFTDEDAVLRLLPMLQGKLRYAGGTKGLWYVWTGHRWERDNGLEHERVIREHMALLARAMMERAELAPKKAEGAPYRKFAGRLQSADGVAAITKLLRAKVNCQVEDFDPEPLELNTPAGVVDLRTGAITPPDPTGMHSRSTAVPPEPGPTPLWSRFLSDLTGGDAELQRFLQKALGYALTGVVSEKTLWFMWGSETDTGKSTFIRTVSDLFGDYADSVDADVLINTRRSSIPAELARLPGVRLVTATEPAAGHAWDEKRIKSITGGDRIEVRFLYGQPFTYMPQFKIAIVGNHEPEIRTVDSAMLRRIHIVPMNHQVPREKQIAGLDERMVQEEGRAILAWIIEGCRLWQSEGLTPPDAVLRTTKQYEGEQDTIQQWIDEECELDVDAITPRQELYNAWSSWCRARGEDPGGMKGFKGKMDPKKRTLQLEETQSSADTGRLRAYRGIRLRLKVEFGTDDTSVA